MRLWDGSGSPKIFSVHEQLSTASSRTTRTPIDTRMALDYGRTTRYCHSKLRKAADLAGDARGGRPVDVGDRSAVLDWHGLE